MLSPNVEVTIRPNQVSVRNLDSGRVASVNAPFSCDHLLADDVDILEHASHRALKEVVGRFWSFPRVTVSTAGRPIHIIERKVISDALMNAGASRVAFDQSLQGLNEQTLARDAYVEQAKRKT